MESVACSLECLCFQAGGRARLVSRLEQLGQRSEIMVIARIVAGDKTGGVDSGPGSCHDREPRMLMPAWYSVRCVICVIVSGTEGRNRWVLPTSGSRSMYDVPPVHKID